MRPVAGYNDIVVALTGASGVIYGLRLIEVVSSIGITVHTIITENAEAILREECGPDSMRIIEERSSHVYKQYDWSSPLASSGFLMDAMVICPCTVKTLCTIASGISENVVTRCAAIALRKKVPLILVLRETPLNSIEIECMLKASIAGAIILPACPAFYHRPKRIDDLIDFVVGKILDVLKIPHKLYKKWSL